MRVSRYVAACTLATLMFSANAFSQTQEGNPALQGVAQTRFNKGRELFIAGQFAPALVEFRAATALYESPNTRLYIARCERELGHVASAYIEFERAASEAADRSRGDPRYTSTRDVAKQESGALEPKLAHVTVLAPNGLPDGIMITMNGAPLGSAAVGVAAPIDPGPIEIVATAPGYLLQKKTARASAGESVEIKVQLEKDPAATQVAVTTTTTIPTTTIDTTTTNNEHDVPIVRDNTAQASHGLRNAGFVVGGIGIAGMGVFAAFAALAQNRYDELKRECGGACDASYNDRINEGAMFATVANIALAASGALIFTGAIMIIAGVSSGKPPATSAAITPLPGGGFMFGATRAF